MIYSVTCKGMVTSALLVVASASLAEEIDYATALVLCAYKFNAQAHEVGRVCYLKRDKNFVVELGRVVDKYREFVVNNTDGDLSRVQRNENIDRSGVHKDPAAVVDTLESQGCKSIRKAARDWYNGQIITQKAKIQDLMDSTRKILAVDRKPTSDGC